MIIPEKRWGLTGMALGQVTRGPFFLLTLVIGRGGESLHVSVLLFSLLAFFLNHRGRRSFKMEV